MPGPAEALRFSVGPTLPEQPDRYHRQMLLPGVGPEGQARLARSHAVVIGCGALGTVAADSLCRAGVGAITIVDRDVVELTNLQRQTLFDEADAREGVPKAVAAQRRLAQVNGSVRVVARVEDFTHRNAERLAAGADVLLDCTDNFLARYLVNDVSVKLCVPHVYAGAVGTVGMARAGLPRRGGAGAPAPKWPDDLATPCLRCLFEEAPAPGSTPTCDTAGVLGPPAGVAALIQSAEAIKILLGRFDLVRRELVVADLWDGPVRTIGVGSAFDAECPCCVGRGFAWLSGAMDPGTTSLCGRNAVQINGAGADESDGDATVDLFTLSERLRAHGEVLASASLVRCVLQGETSGEGEPLELTVFPDGRAIVRGTRDSGRARAVFAKYVGA